MQKSHIGTTLSRSVVYNTTMREDQIENFVSKVDDTGDCWEWRAGKSVKGYGAFRLDSRTVVLSHRITAWAADIISSLDDPRIVHHTCENKLCCNPRHLEATNRRDHASGHNKGRPSNMPNLGKRKYDVSLIKTLHSQGMNGVEIAQALDVPKPTVYRYLSQ